MSSLSVYCHQKLLETAPKRPTAAAKAEFEKDIARSSEKLFQALQDIRLDNLIVRPLAEHDRIRALPMPVNVNDALALAIRSLFSSKAPEGWTSVVVIVLLLGGIQLVMLGVLGEYLWRGVHEARERPLFVARKPVVERAATEPAPSRATNDSAHHVGVTQTPAPLLEDFPL